MKSQETYLRFAAEVWEDLVHDFLEMACFLKIEEQNRLVQELQKEKIQAESIEVFPCFAINGRAVIVCEDGVPEQCWLYSVKKQRIRKIGASGGI